MVRKWKMWWAWQDREHEEWLAAQSRRGLHLRRVSVLGLRHHFEPGAPAEIAYRWDFRPRGGKRDYMQLFKDAGWQLVGDVGGGWLCWSKPAQAGSRPEIFTDRASLRNKYRSLLAITVPGLALLPLILTNRDIWLDLSAGGRPALVAGSLVALGAFSLALTGYATQRLWRRMQDG